jgi:hypothetical protein
MSSENRFASRIRSGTGIFGIMLYLSFLRCQPTTASGTLSVEAK